MVPASTDMTKSKQAQNEAVAVLRTAGFQPVGNAPRLLTRLASLGLKGGDARLVRPGSALRVKVGKANTWFYEVVNGKTNYLVNLPTEQTGRISFFANESRGKADGGNSQMVEGIPVNTARRPRRSFSRFLVAVAIGVAGTLAWQSYGETAKQTVATRAPQLAWSPESRQMIASMVRQLGWRPDAPQTAPATTAAPMASGAPADQQQVQQMARDLAKVRQAVEQLAASKDQMAGDIAKLQAADQEILQRMSELRPRPATAPARVPRQ